MIDPKIGLELNFYRDDITKVVKDVFDSNTKNKENLKLKYKEFIKEWLEQYNQYFNLEINSEEHKGHVIEYSKVSHQIEFDGHGGPSKIEYWIKPTFDSGCVEIIAKPLLVSDYENEDIKFHLENCIFEIMKELKFSTGDENAPGHLNVDFKTGFDSKISNVLEIFRYLNNQQKDNLIIVENLKFLRDDYLDPLNSTYISDLIKENPTDDSQKALITICEKYEDRVQEIINDNSNWRWKLKNLMEQVKAIYLCPNTDQDPDYENPKSRRKKLLESFLDKEMVEKIITKNYFQSYSVSAKDWSDWIREHYMAFNTESFDEALEENWRVEFRAVKMPLDYDKLLKQLRWVVAILEQVNQPNV